MAEVSGRPIVRVATFNIRNGWGRDGRNSWPFRRRSTASAIEALGADVIGLQEVFEWQRRYLARRLPRLRWFGQGRSGQRRGEQCPIAVAGGAITVSHHETRWFGPTPRVPRTRLPGASFPRIATIVRCRDGRGGTAFDVVNTHLDEHIAANRVASVEQLVSWLDPAVPTVVMGDFNAVPSDAPSVFAPFSDAGFQRAPVMGGTTHGFTGRANGPQIDHVLASSHWQLMESAVVHERPGGRLASDHWPVRAALSFG